jgi:hypothetical protein
MGKYEIAVSSTAKETMTELAGKELITLADSLRNELDDTSSDILTFKGLAVGDDQYHAKRLSSGHVVVYRQMHEPELGKLAQGKKGMVADRGYVIFNVLDKSSTETLPTTSAKPFVSAKGVSPKGQSIKFRNTK